MKSRNTIVSISLDSKSVQIWDRLKGSRSAWVRRMLAYHGLQEGTLVNHDGTPHPSWGLWIGDARCNPFSREGMCTTCWTYNTARFIDAAPWNKGDFKEDQENQDRYRTVVNGGTDMWDVKQIILDYAIATGDYN